MKFLDVVVKAERSQDLQSISGDPGEGMVWFQPVSEGPRPLRASGKFQPESKGRRRPALGQSGRESEFSRTLPLCVVIGSEELRGQAAGPSSTGLVK